MNAILFLALAGAAPPASEQAAIFRAAGFERMGADWRTQDCIGLEGASYSPGSIERFEDLNGDGRPEAVVTEGGAICYGNTGSHFWLLSKQPNGAWKRMMSETGLPDFLTVKGAGGWPDIELGGPGFCFPVYRWDGRAYTINRFEYEGKRCKRPN